MWLKSKRGFYHFYNSSCCSCLPTKISNLVTTFKGNVHGQTWNPSWIVFGPAGISCRASISNATGCTQLPRWLAGWLVTNRLLLDFPQPDTHTGRLSTMHWAGKGATELLLAFPPTTCQDIPTHPHAWWAYPSIAPAGMPTTSDKPFLICSHFHI